MVSRIWIFLFTFSATSCMIIANRVGSLASSAAGTGSCPVDEGFFHDEISAPAVAYGNNLLYVATILGRANGRLYMRCLFLPDTCLY